MLQLHWYDFVGFVGVALVIGAYFALQTGRMHGESMLFSLLNAIGAAGILVPVWYAKEMNWSVLLIEGIWILISLYGMWRAMTSGFRKAPPTP